jgi:ACS family hexuronate transporter-like MFS transporter
MLAASRLLLGIGEGGGFPAATRAIMEWFPVKERSTAMGIINAGTAVGAVIAPPGIAFVILHVHWLQLSSWRWVFFLTGAAGLLWTVWWMKKYFPPEQHRGLAEGERAKIKSATEQSEASPATIPLPELLRFREIWGIVTVKFLSDAAWYFYIFWLPKYLLDARGFDIKAVGSVAWIPYAAAGIGCLLGGGLSSWLIHRGHTVNIARKIPLGIAAAAMPWVMLVPHVSVPWCILLFSLAFFGHQWWSTLIMILPTDLFPKRAIGTVAGLVGLGGAMGGVVLGQIAGYLPGPRLQLRARPGHRWFAAPAGVPSCDPRAPEPTIVIPFAKHRVTGCFAKGKFARDPCDLPVLCIVLPLPIAQCTVQAGVFAVFLRKRPQSRNGITRAC